MASKFSEGDIIKCENEYYGLPKPIIEVLKIITVGKIEYLALVYEVQILYSENKKIRKFSHNNYTQDSVDKYGTRINNRIVKTLYER